MTDKDILLHICCAPCSLYCIKTLREEGMSIHGFWYNPNIHPYTEYMKRYEEVIRYMSSESLPLVSHDDYALEDFLRKCAYHETERCSACYEIRMEEAARYALEAGFSMFTTSLLYSKFQNHDLIRKTGEQAAEKFGIQFYYRDFREGWRYGVDTSKSMDMYRQQYCGCIYSEKDRYIHKENR